MLRRSSVLTALFAVFAFAGPAQGQVLIGPEIAFHDDADFGVGAGVELDLLSVTPGLSFMGDFLIFFPDGFDYWEANANATYDISLENSNVVPFVLGGLNISNVSVDDDELEIDESTTDVGFNVGGGIKFDLGSLRPRAGARFTFGENDAFVIFGFLPFALGGTD